MTDRNNQITNPNNHETKVKFIQEENSRSFTLGNCGYLHERI